MPKNIPTDINMEINELEHNKTYKYFGINEVNCISYAIDKKIKEFCGR